MGTTLSRATGRLEGSRAALQANPTAPFKLAAVAVFVAVAASEAGFYAVGQPGLGWYPAALILLGLLAGAVVAGGMPRAVPRPLLAALALLAGYTAWSYLSIAWADQQAVAWDGANRTAVYLVVLALFSLWPVSTGAARMLVAAFGLGIAGLGLVELLRADAAADATTFFVDARFAEPAGYINANVAVWTLGLWPCLYLAGAREVHPLVRGPALGGAGLLAALGLMGQSRGWVLVVPVTALVYVALMPARARAVTTILAVALGTLLVGDAVLSVHDEFTPEAFDALLAEATRQILLMAAVLTVLGILAALADRRVSVSEGTARTANRIVVAALMLALLAGGGVATARTDDPVGRLSDTWSDFKRGGEARAASEGGSRLSSVGTNRYDFWQVAWDRFTAHPVRGIGSENFQQDYLERGDSGEQPLYPHSLALGVLSQTGLVGGLLFGLALGAALAGTVGLRRRVTLEAAAVGGVALVTFAYWLMHASVDWFWEFAGITAPAFAMLGLALSAGRGAEGAASSAGAAPRRRLRALPPAVPTAAAALAGVALAVSLALPWLSERETRRAITGWRESPRAAFDRLDRASGLNPLAPRPHLAAATIALEVEDPARALRELERVLELEPRTPFALAELAALASERGDHSRAQNLLQRAKTYAPRDAVVGFALKRVKSGRGIDVGQLNSSYRKAARAVIGRD